MENQYQKLHIKTMGSDSFEEDFVIIVISMKIPVLCAIRVKQKQKEG